MSATAVILTIMIPTRIIYGALVRHSQQGAERTQKSRHPDGCVVL